MKTKIALLVAIVSLFAIQDASASILGFTQADLLSMVVDHDANVTYFGPGDGKALSPGPGVGAYDGDAEAMTGVAGSNEHLGSGGVVGYVFYSLTGTELAAFNAASAGGDTFRMVGYNDNNNDLWELGVWYESTSGSVFESGSAVVANTGKTFTITIPDTVKAIGVFVRSGPGLNDQFHASWVAPEPGTIAIWGMFAGFGLIGVRRRKTS